MPRVLDEADRAFYGVKTNRPLDDEDIAFYGIPKGVGKVVDGPSLRTEPGIRPKAAPVAPRPKPVGADFASTILQDSSAPAVLRTATDAATEIITHPIDTAGAVVKAVPKVVEAAGMSALKAVITPRSRANETLAGELIRRSEERGRKYAEGVSPKRPFAKALAENIPSLGFSAVAMGAGLGAGVGTAIATTPAGGGVGNIALGTAAGMEASGLAAFQMAKNDIMTTYLDAENDASIAAGKGPLTPKREAELREEFANKAVRYGLWEAIPEAIGNVAGFGVFTAPLKKIVGAGIASRMEKGLAGKAAGWVVKGGAATVPEIATETVTGLGQQRQTAGTVLAPDEKPRSFTSLEDWGKSAKEVAAQTIFTVTLMGGASLAAKKAYSFKTAPKKQAADMVAAAEDFAKNPDALQTLPTEALTGLLAESDTLATKFPKAKDVVEPLSRVKEVFAAELERRSEVPEPAPAPAPVPAKSKVGDAIARKKKPAPVQPVVEVVPEPVPPQPIPDIAAVQPEPANTYGLDASRRKYLDDFVTGLGSIEEVDAEFKGDTPRDNYARAKAREIFQPQPVEAREQPTIVEVETEEEVPITDEAPAYDAEAAKRIADQVSGVAAKPMDLAAKVMRDNVVEAGSYAEVDKRYPVLDSPKSKAGKQQIKDREAALKMAEEVYGRPVQQDVQKPSTEQVSPEPSTEPATIRQSLIVQPETPTETAPNEEAQRETPSEAVLIPAAATAEEAPVVAAEPTVAKKVVFAPVSQGGINEYPAETVRNNLAETRREVNNAKRAGNEAEALRLEREAQSQESALENAEMSPDELQAKLEKGRKKHKALLEAAKAITGRSKEAKANRQAANEKAAHIGRLVRDVEAQIGTVTPVVAEKATAKPVAEKKASVAKEKPAPAPAPASVAKEKPASAPATAPATAPKEGELSPKEKQAYLLGEIAKARAAVTEDSEGDVIFEVPGGGKYSIPNNERSLAWFASKAKDMNFGEDKGKKIKTVQDIYNENRPKPSGKRLKPSPGDSGKVIFYRPYDPKKADLVDSGRKIDNYYSPGWYSNGVYLVKVDKKPSIKSGISDHKTDLAAFVEKATASTIPATIVGETTTKGEYDAPVLAHVVTDTGGHHFFNVNFFDSILTLHPGSDISVTYGEATNNAYAVFKKDGKVVGVVGSMRTEAEKAFGDRIYDLPVHVAKGYYDATGAPYMAVPTAEQEKAIEESAIDAAGVAYDQLEAARAIAIEAARASNDATTEDKARLDSEYQKAAKAVIVASVKYGKVLNTERTKAEKSALSLPDGVVPEEYQDKRPDYAARVKKFDDAKAVVDSLWAEFQKADAAVKALAKKGVQPSADNFKEAVSVKTDAERAYLMAADEAVAAASVIAKPYTSPDNSRSYNSLFNVAPRPGVAAKINDAFWKFFGDSKVTDEKNEPLLVYHHGSFDETTDTPEGAMHFGTEQAARERAYGKIVDDAAQEVEAYQNDDDVWHWDDGRGTTSEDLDLAGFEDEVDALANGQAYVVGNYDTDNVMEDAEDLGNFTAAYLSIQNPKYMPDLGGGQGEWDAAIAQAKAEGHDGIIYKNKYEDKGSRSYIIFDSGQAKSVNNAGTWNKGEASLLKNTSDVAPSSTAGMTSDAVTATINPAMDKWPNMPFNGVIVVESIDELPGKYGDAARATEKKSGGVVRGFFNPETQTIFLIANNIASERDAIEVLIHEAVGHYGLRGALGNQLDAFLGDLARVKSAEVKAHAAKVGLDFNDPSQRLTAAEEWMATQIQNGTLAKGWMQRLGEVIRKIIRSIGIKLTLNDNDIAAIAKKAYEFVEKGKTESVAGREAYDVAAKTDTPNFKRWFGNSKVVDKDGKPLVVYHWSDYEFDAFDMDISKEGAHFGSAQAASDRAGGYDGIDYEIEEDDGSFFVVADSGSKADEWQGPFGSKKEAEVFKKKQPKKIEPIAAYLRIENPVRLPDLGTWGTWDIISHLPSGTLSKKEKDSIMESDDKYKALRDTLLKKGIDGIVYENEIEDKGSDSYIAFSPTQIKSVFNDGTYGLDDPRILFNTEVPTNLLPEVPPHNGAPVRSAATRFVDFAKAVGRKTPPGNLKSNDEKDIREAFRMLSMPYHYAQNYPEYAALLRVQQQREGDSAQRTKRDSDILQGYYGQKSGVRKLINDIILAGDTAVETYSDEQLSAWGLDTPEKRAGYHAVREIMDNKLEKQLTWEISALLQKDATIQELLADEEFTEEDLEDFALEAARTIMARNDKFNTVVTDENFEAKVVEALRGVDTITSELVDLADRTKKLVGYVPHTWKEAWRVKAFKPVEGDLLDVLRDIQKKFVAALDAAGDNGKAADRARNRARNAIKNLTRNFEQAKALRYGDVEKFGPILDAMAANKDIAYVAGQEFIYDVPIGVDTYRLTHQGIKDAANEKAKAVILRNNPGMTNEQFQEAFKAGAFFLIQNREVPVDMFSGAPPGAIESIIEATHRRMLKNYEHYKATGDVTEAELERFKIEAKESVMEMYKAKGWARHMLERKGVGGYRTDLENVIAEYVTGFNSMESKALAARNFAIALGAIDPTKTPRLWRSAREYVRDMLGDMAPVGTGIKKGLGAWFIAGDASAAALNMAQNFTHGIAVLRQIKGKHVSERDMFTAMADVAGQWTLDTKKRRDLFKTPTKFIDENEINALRVAYERGTLDPAHFGEFTGLRTAKVYNNVVDTGWRLVYSAFTATESHNRMAMFLAAYRRAVSGGAGPREAMEKAAWAVNEAHMMYGRGNQPEAIRKLGWVGQVGWTFMTFPMANLSFLGRRAFRATPYINRNVPQSERKEARASLATTLAYTMALGGTASFPLLWLAKLATDWADDDPDKPTYEEKLRMWAEKILKDGSSAQFVARALTRGLPAAFGIDMSQKIEGTQLTGFTGIQALMSIYRRLSVGAGYIKRGEILDGIMLAAPDMLRSPYAATMLEGGVDRPGYPLIEYTPTQKVVAVMGFPTTEAEEERTKAQQIEKMRQSRNDKLNDIADKFIMSLEKGIPTDEIKTELEKYNKRRLEIGRMPPITSKEVFNRAKQRYRKKIKGYGEANTPKYLREAWRQMSDVYDPNTEDLQE